MNVYEKEFKIKLVSLLFDYVRISIVISRVTQWEIN